MGMGEKNERETKTKANKNQGKSFPFGWPPIPLLRYRDRLFFMVSENTENKPDLH